MSRPTKDRYFLAIAAVVASRSTCLRRAVGCVIVNARGHILATGYNGVAAGQPHCNEEKQEGVDFKQFGNDPSVMMPQRMITVHPYACEGARAASGTKLDACGAIHGEQNALLQCRDVWEIDTVYVTTEPCVSCTKLLLGTSARRVVFAAPYAGGGRAIWEAARGPEGWEIGPDGAGIPGTGG